MSILKKLLSRKALFVFLTPILLYSYMYNAQISHIDNFCNSVKTGMTVDELKIVAKKMNTDIERHALHERDKTIIIVESSMTLGEYACLITYKDNVVIKKHLGL